MVRCDAMALADYPLADVIWTIVVFFGWVIWISVLMMVLYDNFRRPDHSGVAKAAWTVFVIFVPVVGVLVYIATRPHMMAVVQGTDPELTAKQ